MNEEKNPLIDALKDNYGLITTMGVFGAISTYLTTLPAADDLLFQTGIVASFLLFILISIFVFWRIRNKLINLESP